MSQIHRSPLNVNPLNNKRPTSTRDRLGSRQRPGFFLDYRPRIRPRSINQTRNPGKGPGFSLPETLKNKSPGPFY